MILENEGEGASLRRELKKAHPLWFVKEAETTGPALAEKD